ncbi:MAG TPA: DUF4386 domain-containing protein [Steroidobacteraceae bacterium]|nr:DUF4386 domain-containing protein [Steroidobacteraceae bacterium]
MASQTFEEYPQRYARIGGALYLAIILLGAFAEGLVANKLVVSGDAIATAHNILGSPGLWQLSVAGDLIVVLCAVPLLWIEYLLLKPVSKHVVLLALLFNLVSLAVEAISKLFLIVVVPTLGSTDYSLYSPRSRRVISVSSEPGRIKPINTDTDVRDLLWGQWRCSPFVIVRSRAPVSCRHTRKTLSQCAARHGRHRSKLLE